MTPGVPARATVLASPLIHPILFAAHPVLLSFSRNCKSVPFSEVVRPLLICVGLSAAVMALFRIFLKAPRLHKAALCLSAALVLLFAYGDVRAAVPHSGVIWLAACILILPLTAGLRYNAPAITRWANVASACLVVAALAPVVTAVVWRIEHRTLTVAEKPTPDEDKWAHQSANPTSLPDIYYIILDAYGRHDVLQSRFGYDDSAFLSALESRGFWVPESPCSNYPMTTLSLASSLNMQYLDEIGTAMGPSADDQQPLLDMLKRGRVMDVAEKLGYTVVPIECPEGLVPLVATEEKLLPKATVFERSLYETTALTLLRKVARFVQPSRGELERPAVLAALNTLSALPPRTGPRFVFAHILCPHPPYRIRADGSVRDTSTRAGREICFPQLESPEDAEGYVGQVEFLDHAVPQILDHLMAISSPRPIVILQSDHGPPCKFNSWDSTKPRMWRQRLRILSALYLPGVTDTGKRPPELDHPGVTPVNTFRAVFNQYFGAHYRMLPDVSYGAHYDKPYGFIRHEPNQPDDDPE